MQTRRISFAGTGGMLDARLELPSAEPRAYALFAHCFTCSKDTVAASRISRALAERGIAVLRFDFTGLGGSDGDFSNTNFSSNIQDLHNAVAYLRETATAPGILIGHSLGGAAVLSAAGDLPEAVAVVTIGAPSDPAHVEHLFKQQVDNIAVRGEQEVELGGRRFLIRQQFLEDIAEQRLTDKIRRLRRALLILHSPQDDIVGVEHARTIFEAALHPKSFISLDGSDHLITRRQDADYVAAVVSAWVDRYLAPRKEDDEARDQQPRSVSVAEAGEGGFAQHVTIGPHTLRGDEPAAFGGQDTGPSPYDFLLAALGTCTSMTLRMYAQHKQLPLEHVAVELSHQKIHARDCMECETQSGRIDRIDRVIRMSGELDAAQRKRLLAIADKCPVHKTLHSEVLISTVEADVSP